MKRKWILIFVVLTLAVAGLLVCFAPTSRNGPVAVSFLALTNDVSGTRIALFSASNGTDRLFVRGRSEVEVQGSISNQVTVAQITNVDYLQPGQSLRFSVPCPADASPWRLKFYYIGQFHSLESLKYEIGWGLKRSGFGVPSDRLPKHDVREITTEWISK